MKYFLTSEAVSSGHPDKVADQISDAIVDAYLAKQCDARVAAEALVTKGLVVLAGEVNSRYSVRYDDIVRGVVHDIGYNRDGLGFSGDSCAVVNTIHQQSQDIARGVNRGKEQGAGDQGIMFGYATNETPTFMPLAHYLSTLIIKTLEKIREEGISMPYLLPDAKSQVTIEYQDGKAVRVDTILVSTQHKEFASDAAMQQVIKEDVVSVLMPIVKQNIKDEAILALFHDDIRYLVNPTGKFVTGGPAGDTGLTGRKIIVDTYGGAVPHGGGAFSGKDPSKVDRSAAYMARFIAKNLVANRFCGKCVVQLSYGIGLKEPISILVKSEGNDEDLTTLVRECFPLTPWGIIHFLKLDRPIYRPTAAGGHFGRENYERGDLSFFPWEKVYGGLEEIATWKRQNE